MIVLSSTGSEQRHSDRLLAYVHEDDDDVYLEVLRVTISRP